MKTSKSSRVFRQILITTLIAVVCGGALGLYAKYAAAAVHTHLLRDMSFTSMVGEPVDFSSLDEECKASAYHSLYGSAMATATVADMLLEIVILVGVLTFAVHLVLLIHYPICHRTKEKGKALVDRPDSNEIS